MTLFRHDDAGPEPDEESLKIEVYDTAILLDQYTHGDFGFGSPQNSCPCAEAQDLTVEVMLSCLDYAANVKVQESLASDDTPPDDTTFDAPHFWLNANLEDKENEASNRVSGWLEIYAADPEASQELVDRIIFPSERP